MAAAGGAVAGAAAGTGAAAGVDFAAQADDRTIAPESSTVVRIRCGRLGDMFDTAWGRNTEDITDRAAPCSTRGRSQVCSPGRLGPAPRWRTRDHSFEKTLLHGARDPGVPAGRDELRPEPAAGAADGRRLQPVQLAVDRADDLLGAHHRLRRPARAEHQVLRADRLERRLEDRGRRHLLRADLRERRHAQHGLDGHRALRSEHPLSRHRRADARAVEHARQRRVEVDRRRQDVDKGRPREELLHQQDRSRFEEPRHRLRRGRREALRQRDGQRARPFQDGGRRQDLDEPGPDEGPRRGRRRHRPAQLRQRHHRVVQGLSPRVDVCRPAARQRALQEHRRRQDLEEAGAWPPAEPGAGPHRARDLREEPEHRLREGRRGSEPRLPGARRRRQFPRAGGRRARRRRRGRRLWRRGELQAGLVVFGAEDVQARPAVRQSGRDQVHAIPGREGSRLHHEAQRGDRRQGLPDEEQHRRREVHPGGAQDVRERRGNDVGARRAREAGEEAARRRRLHGRQGAVPDRQPTGARNAVLGRAWKPAAAEAQRCRLPQRRPGRHVDGDDPSTSSAAAAAR